MESGGNAFFIAEHRRRILPENVMLNAPISITPHRDDIPLCYL